MVVASEHVHKLAPQTARIAFGVLFGIFALMSISSQMAARKMQGKVEALHEEMERMEEMSPKKPARPSASSSRATKIRGAGVGPSAAGGSGGITAQSSRRAMWRRRIAMPRARSAGLTRGVSAGTCFRRSASGTIDSSAAGWFASRSSGTESALRRGRRRRASSARRDPHARARNESGRRRRGRPDGC